MTNSARPNRADIRQALRTLAAVEVSPGVWHVVLPTGYRLELRAAPSPWDAPPSDRTPADQDGSDA